MLNSPFLVNAGFQLSFDVDQCSMTSFVFCYMPLEVLEMLTEQLDCVKQKHTEQKQKQKQIKT